MQFIFQTHRHFLTRYVRYLLFALLLSSCGATASVTQPTPDALPSATAAITTATPQVAPAATDTTIPEPTQSTGSNDDEANNAPTEAPQWYTYRVITSYPHDSTAFTQGLLFDDGVLYEGTGLYGESTLRRVQLTTGEVEQKIALPEQYFGEGVTIVGNRIFQLTWRENTGFIYDKSSFEQLAQFSYDTQGWGLTYDGTNLIMSDGSQVLYFLDPDTQQVVNQVTVSMIDPSDQVRKPVVQLNELEYINGEIYANIWQTDFIVRIQPTSGNVTGVINLSGLLPAEERTATTDVLNGIAYLPDENRLFVTGKKWPKLFEIELIEQ